jgi:competence protein ComEC
MMFIQLILSTIVSTYLKKRTFCITLTVIPGLLGMFAMSTILTEHLDPHHIAHYVTGEKVTLEGVLYKNPEVKLDKTRLYLNIEKTVEENKIVNLTGKMLLTIKQKSTSFSSGDRIRFFAKIRLPRNFNNPGRFDYKRYLALKGIMVIASLSDEASIIKVKQSSQHIPSALLARYRSTIENFLSRHLPPPERAIARALILGEKGDIPEDVRRLFAATGVAHILAISGLHIGIIAFVSFWLMKNLLKCFTWIMLATDISKVAALITILPVTAYCFIAGSHIATVRATIMVVTYLISILLDRRNDLWNTLSLAALSILTVSPSSLFDISFQLSFISVIAIISISPPCASFVYRHTHDPLTPKPGLWKSAGRRITLFLIITTAAMIGTAPIVALYFNRLSPWGLLTNLIIIPLVGFLVVPLGLFTVLLTLLYQPLAIWGTHFMQTLLALALKIVHFFAALPYADYRTTTPTLLEIVLFYTGIVCLLQLGKSKVARWSLAFIALAFITVQAFWYYQVRLNPLLRITAIDVGQGESTLVQFPYGKTMLIDGGGFSKSTFDIGEKVVAPVLWKKKIKNLDLVVLTHPHPDHLNGLVSLVKNFKVHEVWTNGEHTVSEAFEALEGIIEKKGIRNQAVSSAQINREIGGVIMAVLHPPPSAVYRSDKPSHILMNNHSLVVRLVFKKVSILLTGDICEAAERDLLKNPAILKSTILKVPHHGSKTSSSLPFLKAVDPSIAILSVGDKNIFRLPHPAILKRYRNQGCKLLRTDCDGAISIETNGSAIYLETFLKSGSLNHREQRG